MIKFLLPILILFFLPENTFSQKQEYNIVKGGKTIGNLLAEKKIIGDTTIITITSEAKFKLLFSFNVSYLLEEKFVGDILVSGNAINYLNGKIQKTSSVQKKGNKYIVELDGEPSEFALNKISYSITSIYFEQPPQLNLTIFSQQFADFLPLYYRSNNEYELESANGNNNYSYQNGILETVKISRNYATFYFKLKQ